MKKRVLSVILAATMVMGLLAGCSSVEEAESSAAEETTETTESSSDTSSDSSSSSGEYSYVIGHYGGITGTTATVGTAGYNGIQLAIQYWNDNGGVLGGQIGFEFYDDGGTTEGAVKAVTYLLEEKNVDGLISSQLSGNIQATGDQVEAAQVPEVGTGMNPAWLEQGWTYLFRSVPNNAGGAQPLVDAMLTVGVTDLGAMIYQDDGNTSAWAYVTEVLENTPEITLVAEEQAMVGESDWTGTLTSILNKNPNGVLIFAQGEQASLMIKQLRELGYEGYIFGPETFSLPDIRNVAGDGANGIIFFAPHCIPDSADEANSEAEQEFLELYEAAYGELPASDVAYRAWDATNILLTAVEQAGTADGPTVRDTIANLKIDILAGSADFSAYDNGECLSGQQIYITHEGKNILFSTFCEENDPSLYMQ
ncbi:MAG: ABC transporter substrate-binding protein [Lachnospiraceae bacterium]|nr:ABC transporter substrate-binding protein [Lachnospiraceae bacterium]